MVLAQSVSILDGDSLFIKLNGAHYVEIQSFQRELTITTWNQEWLLQFPDVDDETPRLVSWTISSAAEINDSIRTGWRKFLLIDPWTTIDSSETSRRRSKENDVYVEVWRACETGSNKRLVIGRGYYTALCHMKYKWTNEFANFHKMLDDLAG
ncbi:hypothetical protein GCM10011318_04830 [Phaeocystidibacter marisrubri]|nr:hypothetical protein GCM10011318_04830 [Phaeocystidibacter marisrubri]